MKMTGKLLAVLSLVVLVVGLTGADALPQQVPVAEIGSKYVLMGQLGQPIGGFMTIEGVAQREWMGMGWPVAVDTVDGKKWGKAVIIGVMKPVRLVEGTRYVLRGYEAVGMSGTPEDPQRRQAGQGNMVQQPLGFRNWFEVTEVKEPANVEERK
jgi:hypothetical protein